jgi:hypothetical protein
MLRSCPGRMALLAQTLVAGVALGIVLKSMTSPAVYTRDLEQEYVTARALRDGVSIFTPITELSSRYLPVATDNFSHPSPHPPLLALLAIPLTFLSLPRRVACWLAVNVCLLLDIGRRSSLSPSASLALAAWPPLWAVLVLGQLEVVVLALALLAWKSAERHADFTAGVPIGVAARRRRARAAGHDLPRPRTPSTPSRAPRTSMPATPSASPSGPCGPWNGKATASSSSARRDFRAGGLSSRPATEVHRTHAMRASPRTSQTDPATVAVCGTISGVTCVLAKR